MSGKPAAVVCSRCAAAAEAGASACPKCGGRLVRVCGACGGRNAFSKNYCDQCGEPLQASKAPGNESAPAAAPSESADASDKILHLPQTGVIRTLPGSTPAASGRTPKPPQKSAHTERFMNLTESPRPDASPKKEIPGARTPKSVPSAGSTKIRRERRSAVYSLASSVLLLAGGAALYAVRWHRNSRPEVALLKTAARYVRAMESRDYETAYGLLSVAARDHASLADFKSLQDGPAWTASDVRISLLEGDLAVVHYTLATQDAGPSENFMFFLKQDDRWVHPWAWGLFYRAEDALNHDAPDLARSAAQAAAAINPKDPLAQAYLCEAAYASHQPEETARACRASLALDEKYRSPLSPQTRAYLHELLADALKNELKRYEEASQEYTTLLGAPGLDSQNQCRWLLARGDCRVAAGAYADALKDFRAAACPDPEDHEYQLHATHALSGDEEALGQATALVQGYRPASGQPTLADSSRALAARVLGAGGAPRGKRRPSPQWSADFLGGTNYQVKSQTAGAVLLTAQADLWTDAVTNIRFNDTQEAR